MLKQRITLFFWMALAGGLFISNTLVYIALGFLMLLWVVWRLRLWRKGNAPVRAAGSRTVLIFVLLFLIWRISSTIHSVSFTDSLLLTWGLGIFSLIFVARDASWNKREAERVLQAGFATATLASLYAVARFILLVPEHAEGFYGGYSLFATLLAMNLGLLTSFFLLEKKARGKWVLGLMGFIQLIALILASERGPWLGALLGMSIAGILSGKKRAWLLPVGLVVLIGVAAFLYQPVTNRILHFLILYGSGRGALWSGAWSAAIAHPLFGSGLNTFRIVCVDSLKLVQDPGVSGCHNDFLQIAFESGFPAFLFYLGLWAAVLQVMFRQWQESRGPERALTGGLLGALAAHALMSFFGTGGSDMAMVYLMLLMGMGLNRVQESRVQSPKP